MDKPRIVIQTDKDFETNEARVVFEFPKGTTAQQMHTFQEQFVKFRDLLTEAKEEVNNRSKLLRGAETAINGDRNNQYGDPVEDFSRTAALITAFLGKQLTEPLQAWQVAIIQDLVKTSRIAETPTKEDSWMDKAGYTACGWDVVKRTLLAPEKVKETTPHGYLVDITCSVCHTRSKSILVPWDVVINGHVACEHCKSLDVDYSVKKVVE